MAVDKRWKSPEMKLRARLSKAQEKLWQAQTKRTRTIVRGELQVEEARWRAAKQLAKATKKVEREAAKVAALEAKLPPLVPPAAEENDRRFQPAQTLVNAEITRSISEGNDILRHDTPPVDQPSSVNGDGRGL